MAARAAQKIEQPAPESDVEKAEAVVVALEARLAEAERTAASFAPRRAELAFAAATGDADAVAALAALTIEEDKAKHAAGDLRDAISESRRRLKAAEAGAATAADQARYAVALKVGDQVIESAEKIDRLFAELRTELDRHEGLVGQLLGTRCLPPFSELGVGGSGRVDIAVRFAGLQNMYRGQRDDNATGCEPLAGMDRRTVAALTLPSKVAKMRPIFS